MQAEHINPFVRSLTNAFATMLACPVRRGNLFLAKSHQPIHPVSGVIGLSGGAVGMVVLNLSEAVALKATSTMLMCEATEMNDDVIDAVGELANVVAGRRQGGARGISIVGKSADSDHRPTARSALPL